MREEANHKCVYCAIHENPLGGYDHFHVEHFRPKSLKPFEKLINDYNNLFYACAICNRFKSNDWPNDPVEDNSIISYPDPNLNDYNDLFIINDNGKLDGNSIAAKYVIEKINLNRPQLIYERREILMREKTNILIKKVEQLRKKIEGLELSKEAYELCIKIWGVVNHTVQLLNEEKEISRYEPSEIKRL